MSEAPKEPKEPKDSSKSEQPLTDKKDILNEDIEVIRKYLESKCSSSPTEKKEAKHVLPPKEVLAVLKSCSSPSVGQETIFMTKEIFKQLTIINVDEVIGILDKHTNLPSGSREIFCLASYDVDKFDGITVTNRKKIKNGERLVCACDGVTDIKITSPVQLDLIELESAKGQKLTSGRLISSDNNQYCYSFDHYCKFPDFITVGLKGVGSGHELYLKFVSKQSSPELPIVVERPQVVVEASYQQLTLRLESMQYISHTVYHVYECEEKNVYLAFGAAWLPDIVINLNTNKYICNDEEYDLNEFVKRQKISERKSKMLVNELKISEQTRQPIMINKITAHDKGFNIYARHLTLHEILDKIYPYNSDSDGFISKDGKDILTFNNITDDKKEDTATITVADDVFGGGVGYGVLKTNVQNEVEIKEEVIKYPIYALAGGFHTNGFTYLLLDHTLLSFKKEGEEAIITHDNKRIYVRSGVLTIFEKFKKHFQDQKIIQLKLQYNMDCVAPNLSSFIDSSLNINYVYWNGLEYTVMPPIVYYRVPEKYVEHVITTLQKQGYNVSKN